VGAKESERRGVGGGAMSGRPFRPASRRTNSRGSDGRARKANAGSIACSPTGRTCIRMSRRLPDPPPIGPRDARAESSAEAVRRREIVDCRFSPRPGPSGLTHCPRPYTGRYR